MTFKVIEFASGHKLTDNMVGDYDLMCPNKGNMGFMHMGQVAALVSAPCHCMGCGESIGQMVTDHEPYTRE